MSEMHWDSPVSILLFVANMATSWWSAILLLTTLAVGSYKKIEWAGRLGYAGSTRLYAFVKDRLTERPAMKAALAVCGPEAAHTKEGPHELLSMDSLKLRICSGRARNDTGVCVWLDGEDQTDLYTARELWRIGAAAYDEVARRQAAVDAKKEADRKMARQILDETLMHHRPGKKA